MKGNAVNKNFIYQRVKDQTKFHLRQSPLLKDLSGINIWNDKFI